MSKNSPPAIGIDFGTSTSAIGFIKDGLPTIIRADSAGSMMPSIVAFNTAGKLLVGSDAKKQAVLNQGKTFRSIKRDIGRLNSYNIDGKDVPLAELASHIIAHLKDRAEGVIGQEIKEAVITVPAYFSQPQRKTVQEVGRLAGLDVKRIINEPTAAAMAYGLNSNEDANLLVFDFGGGTFDVSILSMGGGVFEVLATGGDNRLGGDDIDDVIIENLVNRFEKEHGIDLRQDKLAMQKLRDEAENIKIALSTSTVAKLNIPFITANENGTINLERTLSVEDLKLMMSGITKRLMMLLSSTLQDSGMSAKEIDKVLLVGGSTRVQIVRNAIEEKFAGKLVAGVNPLECVCLGATIQSAIMGGQVSKKVLVDVTPFALGLEIDGGKTEQVIEKNSPIPITEKRIFSTVADNQLEVQLRVVQGNSDIAAENTQLGQFVLGGIEMAKKGVPQIEVIFDVDVNGIMSVSAKDQETGVAKKVTVRQRLGGNV